ncbi:multidrug effflux MFS transporter [Levilactobacillus bambusae]|uniref:Bcr/CflA family efflux transporter n=1 Tax=Levilactobacillus bambusae TaxID=2024736 RepID=A0A2V1N2T3_9LACO|nr:multidrug effflux MFS transporter [Levilactobacillus bambusae]PWG00535.1 Bcr/CflA family drug resistance efflux transporter [Levilactobacillus bambusae]
MAHTNRSRATWLTLLLGTISATGPLSIDLYMPALPQMTTQFHTSASLMQLSITACLVGLALGQVFWGPLSDRYGRKKMLLAGFATFAIASFLITLSHSIGVLIALRFIQGAAGAAGQVLSRAVTSDLFSGNQLTRFYAMLNAVNGLFPIIAPLIGGMLIAVVPWEGIFWLLTLIGILITLAVAIGLPESLPMDKRSTGSLRSSFAAMGKLLTHPRFDAMLLVTGLIYAILFCYISASSFVFQHGFGMSAQAFSWLYAMNGLAMALGSAIPARLVGRLDNRRQLIWVLRLTLLATGCLVLSLFFPQQLWLVVSLLFIILLLNGAGLTLSGSLILENATANAGSVSALIGLSQDGLGGLASPLVGLGKPGSYASMAIWMLISAALALGLTHTSELKPTV